MRTNSSNINCRAQRWNQNIQRCTCTSEEGPPNASLFLNRNTYLTPKSFELFLFSNLLVPFNTDARRKTRTGEKHVVNTAVYPEQKRSGGTTQKQIFV